MSARRWPKRVAIGVVVLLVAAYAAIVWVNRLQFPYDGPNGTVTPGSEVTIRDPNGTCGPLVVSLWRPSVLGQWNQIYKGDMQGFATDERPWWKVWESEDYFTVVPCGRDGETTFPLPSRLKPGEIAVCDGDMKCAKLEIG